MLCTYNGILFSHRNKWNSNTCYIIDEPWKHYAKWNKPDTKWQILQIPLIQGT